MNKDWKYYFYEISKIPRKSGSEEKIRDYIINFAKERGFEYYTDSSRNVVVWKPASNKCENEEIVGLQAHIDMVCEKTPESNHNFYEDPIEIIEQGNLIRAKDTSLGADNGIGVALILAMLDSTIMKHPKLEAIFTTEEETTMNGVANLDGSVLKSKKIISFDNFNEDDIWVGSASSQEWYLSFDAQKKETGAIKTFELELNGFKGGHAGMDIGDEERGNPIKTTFEVLKGANVGICDISAGTLINVIPRSCKVKFNIDENDAESLNLINQNIFNAQNKFATQNFTIRECEPVGKMFGFEESKQMINTINKFEVGAINRDNNNNVIVGSNLAMINTNSDKVDFCFSIRGNERKTTDIHIDKLKNNFISQDNIIVNKYDEWCGYEQPRNNDLINVCENIYKNIYNKTPNVLGVQACLECEFLGMKIPNLEYVALGTNTYDVHSTSERVEIDSVNKAWSYLTEILAHYYERG